MSKYFCVLFLCCWSVYLQGIITLDRSGHKKAIKTEKKDADPVLTKLENPHMPHMIWPSQDRKVMTAHFANKPIKEVFTEIYKSNFWLGPESLSGQGSSIATTQVVRTALPELFNALKITSILDVGCGDFYWMRTLDMQHIDYIGVDLVAPLIDINRQKFGSDTCHFLCLDATAESLPQADLIVCRDVFAHLDVKKVCQALRNFKASGSTFLLATTHASSKPNQSIICGHHFPYNLTKAPFNLPEPLVLIEETTAEQETLVQAKAMGLWLLWDLDLSCLEY